MYVENAPVFGAAGNGLAALFAVDFGVDKTHELPTDGTWQGDRKECRSLYIDNYDNAFPIVIDNGGSVSRCPAYSQGYINIGNNSRITVTCDIELVINMKLYTEQKPEGFTARGNSPSNNLNDPLYVATKALFHFDGVTGLKTGVDEINPISGSNIALGGASIIESNSGKFGGALKLIFDGISSSGGAVYAVGNSYTIEFFLKSKVCVATSSTLLTACGQAMTMAKMSDTTFKLTMFGAVSNVMNTDEYNHIAVVIIASQSFIFVNGECGAIGVMPTQGLTGAISFNDGSSGAFTDPVYIDEMRLTAYARYAQNFTPPAMPFPDR